MKILKASGGTQPNRSLMQSPLRRKHDIGRNHEPIRWRRPVIGGKLSSNILGEVMRGCKIARRNWSANVTSVTASGSEVKTYEPVTKAGKAYRTHGVGGRSKR